MMNTQLCKRRSKMERDLFSSLPQEIMIDILLRLTIRTIGKCKCVCKSWLDFIRTREFINSHYSKSVPCPAFYHASKSYKILEFLDTQDSRHDCKVVFINLDFPPAEHELVCSSVNGLLFLLNRKFQSFLICNPITREYIKLPPPPPKESKLITQVDSYGFGVSKLSGKHKVVRMLYEFDIDARELSHGKCEVYTLGTGLWRRIKSCCLPKTESFCLFFNGNLHWFVRDVRDECMGGAQRISCFDLETERVTTFSAPHCVPGQIMCALGDHGLCVCDNSRDDIVIWSMKEYGDDKSWRKEFVIKKQSPLVIRGALVLPVKIFEDGDILFAFRYNAGVCWYSSKMKTSREREIGLAGLIGGRRPSSIIYTPSFLSLKTLTMEK